MIIQENMILAKIQLKNNVGAIGNRPYNLSYSISFFSYSSGLSPTLFFI